MSLDWKCEALLSGGCRLWGSVSVDIGIGGVGVGGGGGGGGGGDDVGGGVGDDKLIMMMPGKESSLADTVHSGSCRGSHHTLG